MSRTRIAYLTEHDFLSAFDCVDAGFPHLRGFGSVNQIRRVRLVGVPEGARPSRVFYDPARMAFGLVIEHPSFDEVPFGQVPPEVQVTADYFYCDHEGKAIPMLGHRVPSDEVPRLPAGRAPRAESLEKLEEINRAVREVMPDTKYHEPSGPKGTADRTIGEILKKFKDEAHGAPLPQSWRQRGPLL